MVLLKIVERMDDVLEAVHVVPVDVPVPQVPVARVLDVPHVIVHDLPRDVLPELDIPLKHRHLQLAQHLENEILIFDETIPFNRSEVVQSSPWVKTMSGHRLPWPEQACVLNIYC